MPLNRRPLDRRQIYRRRRLAVFGAIALVVAVGLYLPLTLLAPIAYADQTVTKVVMPTSASASITWPAFGASRT